MGRCNQDIKGFEGFHLHVLHDARFTMFVSFEPLSNNGNGAQRDSSVVLNCTNWAGGGWGSGWDENRLVASTSNSGEQTLPHTRTETHSDVEGIDRQSLT